LSGLVRGREHTIHAADRLVGYAPGENVMNPRTEAAFDLDAYRRRIGYAGELAPTPAVLEGLHFAHATRIPFENLDTQLGRPIRLDLDSLQAKLVRDRRGGYCFEQNTLLAAALEAVGFPVSRLLARVRLGARGPTARSHMVLRVVAGGISWLADVGFGSGGLLRPVPFQEGALRRQGAWNFRLSRDGESWLLQAPQEQGWQNLYTFTLEPQFPIDFEVANYFTSTHPESHFVRSLTAQRATLEARYTLRGPGVTVEEGGKMSSRTIADDEELLALLADQFGLWLPAGTRFRCFELTT
jgi:N-hydroxyarylamine O-acetyltransferase